MIDTGPRLLIATERLELHAPDPAQAEALLDFQLRNRAHFAPWDPPLPADFFELDFQRDRLARGARAFAEGTALRWWLVERLAPQRIVGNVHFSQIARAAFQNAMLGYALDERCQGRGLMHEALSVAIDEVFAPAVNLHRVQANVRPENSRSLKVLEGLGFVREGLAREYLFIDGAWRDHVMTARRNPRFAGVPVT